MPQSNNPRPMSSSGRQLRGDVAADWLSYPEDLDWSSEEDITGHDSPARTVTPLAFVDSPRPSRISRSNAEVVETGGSPAGRLAQMGLKTPNKGADAQRAALAPLWSGTSDPTTPSKREGVSTGAVAARRSNHTPLVSGLHSPMTPAAVRHYDRSCRTPQQEARYAAIQEGMAADHRPRSSSPYSSHPMALRSRQKSSEPPVVEGPPSARNLTSELQAALRQAEPKNKPGPHARHWSPDHPLDAVPLEDTYLNLIPPNPHQKLLDSEGVLYGVQWELERQLRSIASSLGISAGTLEPSDVEQLRGPAIDAMARVPSVVRDIFLRELPDGDSLQGGFGRRVSVWSEMDREEAALDQTEMLEGVFNHSSNWPYGGRLVYAVGVRYYGRIPTGESRDTPAFPFGFNLLPLEQPSTSTRLARRFGSRRILTLRFKNVPRRNGAREKLFVMLRGRALVLFGRVFRVIWIGPDSEKAIAIQTDELRLNSLEGKRSQAMSKWAARFQLFQSDSIPAALVDPKRITVIPDIVCDSASDSPQTDEILTDGCGLMSSALALRIKQHPSFTHLTTLPSAVQMRLGGSKGLLVVMSNQQEAMYRGIDVVLRDSMVKSKPSPHFKKDPSNFTLDILRIDGLRMGTTLSSEPAIVMAHNGVPPDVLVDKAQQSIRDIGQAFAASPNDGEDEDSADARLLATVYRRGGVAIDQRKREVLQSGQSCKVAGLVSRQFEEDEDMGDPDDDDEGGEDLSPAEELYRMVRAGIRPKVGDGGCSYAASQLRYLVDVLTKRAALEYRIPIEQSLSAFMVPDPTGVLQPDEVFVSFGQEQPLNPLTHRRMAFLEGDCLVYRSPCKLPTDVRKFKAVIHPALLHLRDCVVFSAHSGLCRQSPASFLGGGDYDGDIATVIWDSDLVRPFKNAPDNLAHQPPGFEKENFAKDVVTVGQFLRALKDTDEATMTSNLQHFLMGHLLDEQLTGHYSEMHAFSAYTRGVDDEETLRLARMFCLVLDSRKSGLSVLPEVKKRDMKGFGGKVAWRAAMQEAKGRSYDGVNSREAWRPAHLPPFIMDEIRAKAQVARLEVLSNFPEPSTLARRRELTSLADAFHSAEKQAETSRKVSEQLRLVKLHVKWASDIYPLIFTHKNLDLVDNFPTYVRPLPLLTSTGGWVGAPLSRQSSGSTSTGSRSSSRSDSGPGKQRRLPASITKARLRDLRHIWHEGVIAAEVPDLVPFRSERALAELKISYAVCLANANGRPVRMPFEVDLETVCNMAAEARAAETPGGQTCTIPAGVAGRLRPRH